VDWGDSGSADQLAAGRLRRRLADGQPVFGLLTVAPDGALWISGPEGLAHFDGQDWAVYPAVEGVQAVAVAPAPQGGMGGTVWLVTAAGAAHFRPQSKP